VNIIFNPAIHLLDRLSFSVKFTVLALLAFIPLLSMSYIIGYEAYSQAIATQSQQQGVKLLSEALKLKQVARQYTAIRVSSSDLKENQVINQAAKGYGAVFLTGLEAFEKRIVINDISPDAIELIAEIKRHYHSSIDVEWDLQIGVEPIYQELKVLPTSVDALMEYVIDESLLSDLSLESLKITLDLMRVDVSQVTELLNAARAFTTYGVTSRDMGSRMMNLLDRVYASLSESEENFKSILNVKIDEAFGQDILTARQAALLSIEKAMIVVDEEFLMATEYSDNWQANFAMFSELIDPQYLLLNALLESVYDDISQVRNEKFQALYKVLLICGFTMLTLIYLFIAFYHALNRSITSMVKSSEKMASGDMTCELTSDSMDELGFLTKMFNESREMMRQFLHSVKDASETLDEFAAGTLEVSSQSDELVDSLLQEMLQIAASVNELSSCIQGMCEHSTYAQGKAEEAQANCNEGAATVDNTLQKMHVLESEINKASGSMEVLNKSSNGIASIMVEIKGIADQVNLLALNASIEASHAGEMGRGFAVVAQEVRTLALRTRQSTADIEGMLKGLQDSVVATSNAMDNSLEVTKTTVQESQRIGDTFVSIRQQIDEITFINGQVASSVTQQAAATKEIDKNIMRIKDGTVNNKEKTKETVAACHKLKDLSDELSVSLDRFIV